MTPELATALAELKRAHEFRELCKKDRETADATGASRDALEWFLEAAEVVAKVSP